MLISRQLKPQVVRREDVGKLAQLTDRARRVHRHLDWHAPEAWIGHRPFYFAMDGRRPVGVFAAPPDPPDTAWVRLLAAADDVPVGDVLRAVWPLACRDLEADGARLAAALAIEAWVGPALTAIGFHKANEVIVLSRSRGAGENTTTDWRNKRISSVASVGFSNPLSSSLRPLRPADLPVIAEIDRVAFDPPWRISPQALRFALDAASLATVAEAGAPPRIAGYQISTEGAHGGHLARLGVLPEYQGRGIATALTADALAYFDRRRADCVTVNTQQDNYASLAVYRRFGFEPTEEVYGAWVMSLA